LSPGRPSGSAAIPALHEAFSLAERGRYLVAQRLAVPRAISLMAAQIGGRTTPIGFPGWRPGF